MGFPKGKKGETRCLFAMSLLLNQTRKRFLRKVERKQILNVTFSVRLSLDVF